jgi:hypothetical protein
MVELQLHIERRHGINRETEDGIGLGVGSHDTHHPTPLSSE